MEAVDFVGFADLDSADSGKLVEVEVVAAFEVVVGLGVGVVTEHC